MNLILFNLRWMAWNIFLASISVILGYLTLKVKPKAPKLLLILIFILFIPNTIYIVTDLAHLIQRWNQVENWARIVVSIQYLIFIPIGFLTFIYSMKLLEKNLVKLDKRFRSKTIMIVMNFIVAFGVVIGRVQRANSWEIITNPVKIFQNLLVTLTSFNLIAYVLALGLFCNILYFGVKKRGVGERT